MPNLMKYFVTGGSIFSEAFSSGLGGSARHRARERCAHNHGVTWGFPPRDLTRLNASSTVATWLKTAGYRTGHIGRYLTGYGWWVDPTTPPGWDDWKTLIDPGSNNTERCKMTLNGTILDFGQISAALGVQLHQVDVVSALATDFVKRESPSESPLFLMLTPVCSTCRSSRPTTSPGSDRAVLRRVLRRQHLRRVAEAGEPPHEHHLRGHDEFPDAAAAVLQ